MPILSDNAIAEFVNLQGSYIVINNTNESFFVAGVSFGPYQKRTLMNVTHDVKKEFEDYGKLTVFEIDPSETNGIKVGTVRGGLNTLAVNLPEVSLGNTKRFSIPNDLVGVEYPEEDPEQTENEQINDEFVLSNNTLFVGRGNPSTDLMQIQNDQIALSLGVRKAYDSNTVPAADGVYSLELNKNEDWTIVYMVAGLTSFPTAYYDITFTLFGDSEGTDDSSKGYISFKLEKRANGYVWVSNEFGKDILDSYVSENNLAVGNITRYTFYPDIITPPVNTPAPYTGTFLIRLSATHKISGEVLTLDTIANITLAEQED